LLISGLAVVLALTVWFSATAVAPELKTHFGLTTSEAVWLTNGVQVGCVVGAIASPLLSLPDVMRLTHLITFSAGVPRIANVALLLEPNFIGSRRIAISDWTGPHRCVPTNDEVCGHVDLSWPRLGNGGSGGSVNT